MMKKKPCLFNFYLIKPMLCHPSVPRDGEQRLRHYHQQKKLRQSSLCEHPGLHFCEMDYDRKSIETDFLGEKQKVCTFNLQRF